MPDHDDSPSAPGVPGRPAPGEQLRLMCVHAHPDDESSKGAAAMVRYLSEGARVMVVTCTGGERGDILNPELKDDPEVLRDITAVRRHEMAEAVRILGVEHVWLGFVDSGLPEGDPLPPLPEGCFALEPVEIPTEALVRVIREFRPHVMTTYDEQGGYPHPDHIMTHTVSMAAFEAAGDPERFPHAGPAWQPQKIYYNQTFSTERLRTYHEALLAKTGSSPFADWLERRDSVPDRPVNARLDVGEYLPTRDEALLAHRTQIDPKGVFFALSPQEQRTLWPWEDYELGRSLVPVHGVEGDLFEGLR
ncbi:MAG: mycothiol conjugate amidase Mca [Actinomycetales bacterium]